MVSGSNEYYKNGNIEPHPLVTYHTFSTEEIGNNFFVDVIQQPTRTLVVIACINQEFLSRVVINKWTNL